MMRESHYLPLLMIWLSASACGHSKPDGANVAGGSSTGGAPGAAGTNSAGSGVGPGSGGSNAGTTAGAGSLAGGSSSGGATGGDATGGADASGAGSGGLGSGGSQSACPALAPATIAAKDIIQFNDNGGWCWYQDERALVDTKAGKFIIGSVASSETDTARNSDQEVVIYDIASGDKKKYTLQADLNPDDHNAPAFVVRPDGKYVATWATHRDNCNTYYSVFDGSAWSKSAIYDWKNDGCPWEPGSDPPHQITYANPWYLTSENRILSAVRSVSTSPAFLQTADGSSWKFYGRISSTPTTGYVAGYFKYWGNGTDRIDFVGTEAHPRDNNNSLWHGYYFKDKLYNSKGDEVDGTANDKDAKNIDQYSLVFGQGSTPSGVSGIKLYRMWNHDLVRYADGTIAVMGQGRTTNTAVTVDDDPDKRLIYSRWDPTAKAWKTTYLVKAGPKLYKDEQDYTGLGALHPDNPNVIFVSTTFDPRTDMAGPSGKRELFMGVTCDNGATFKWTPLTENSTEDNIRPVVPKWDSSHTLLLWLRGKYETAQKYTLKVVGTTSLQIQ